MNRKLSQDWYKFWSTVKSLFPMYYRPFGRSSDHLYWTIQFAPPILKNKVIYYEYIPTYNEMKEYVTGTCATTAGSATVTGLGTDFVNNVVSGDAFRKDAYQSDWYLVASVDSATQLTLTAPYPITTAQGAYTCSNVPQLPTSLQLAIFYGACALSLQDQDNVNAAKNYAAAYAATINDYQRIESNMKMNRQQMRVKPIYRR